MDSAKVSGGVIPTEAEVTDQEHDFLGVGVTYQPQGASYQNSPANNAPYASFAAPVTYVHGYVLGTEQPTGPPRIFDIAGIEVIPVQRNRQFQATSAPNTANTFQNPPLQTNAVYTKSSSGNTKRAAMVIGVVVTYVFGLASFVGHPLSIALSLHLVVSGALHKRRGTVLFLCFAELAAWIMCAGLSWLFVVDYRVSWNGYLELTTVTYYGWIFIVVWFVATLGLGIPRLILSADVNSTDAPYVEQVSTGELENFKKGVLAFYILGFLFYFPHLISICLSLQMLKKGLIGTQKQAILACAVIEFFGWVMCTVLCWLFFKECYVEEFQSLRCTNVYIGWVFIVVWFVLALVFGTLRLVLTGQVKWQQNAAEYHEYEAL